MARKTVLVCDSCGKEVPDGKGAEVAVNFTDARRGRLVGDYCDACAGSIKGRQQARRGRKPAAA